jgi:hypothetical protein
MSQSLREISLYMQYLARQMEKEAEQEDKGDDGEPPTHYLNGQRIS